MKRFGIIQLAVLLLVISQFAGCRCMDFPIGCLRTDRAALNQPEQLSGLAAAQCVMALGIESEEKCQATCVDYYFQAITLIWPDIERQLRETGKSTGPENEVYENALTRLVNAGQRYGRLVPSRGLEVHIENQKTIIPIAFYGFPWRPEDFDRLQTVCQTSSKELTNWYRCDGLGIATIAFHDRRPHERFRQELQGFAATLAARPRLGQPEGAGEFELVLADPIRVNSIDVAETRVSLERDSTAPIAFATSKRDRSAIENFLHPGATTSNSGLFQLEPYQPGKIPVLFIHGLMSDPLTWANIANEMRARPDLMERYQIWGFEYATGEPFLKSAAMLRRQLREFRSELHQHGHDPALQSMVLVGHSMGGLIAKLMVTHSESELWDSVSCRPLEQITATPDFRNALAEAFYFEPLPYVSRVVFIGTPHRGSPWAVRPVGKIGAKLVEEPSSLKAEHQQLIDANPGVFTAEFTRRIPTSIDLLKPTSPLLQGMNRIPFGPNVQRHSVIGSGYPLIGGGNSDRIVPVSSARLGSVATERLVHAKHTKLNANPGATKELFCILLQHALENQSSESPGPFVDHRLFD